MIFVVDLGELERRARAIAPALRLLHVRIVQLTGQPARRRKLAPLGGAKPHCEPAISTRALSGAPFHRPFRMLMTQNTCKTLTLWGLSPHVRLIGLLTPATCLATSSPSSSPSPSSWRRWTRR